MRERVGWGEGGQLLKHAHDLRWERGGTVGVGVGGGMRDES